MTSIDEDNNGGDIDDDGDGNDDDDDGGVSGLRRYVMVRSSPPAGANSFSNSTLRGVYSIHPSFLMQIIPIPPLLVLPCLRRCVLPP